MIEICKNLYIGIEQDFESKIKFKTDWNVVHACKEPYHRQLLGYTGRGAPKEHPEYLIAIIKNQLYLNLVDAADPKYIPKEIINTAIEFIDESQKENKACLVRCNLGESRSPSIGLLYMAIKGLIPIKNLTEAETEFRRIYPNYNPKAGMRGFLIDNWGWYVNK